MRPKLFRVTKHSDAGRLKPKIRNARLPTRLLYRLCDPDTPEQPRAKLSACMVHRRHENPSSTKADTTLSCPLSREPFVGPDLHD